jgi:hypothetical protein
MDFMETGFETVAWIHEGQTIVNLAMSCQVP